MRHVKGMAFHHSLQASRLQCIPARNYGMKRAVFGQLCDGDRLKQTSHSLMYTVRSTQGDHAMCLLLHPQRLLQEAKFCIRVCTRKGSLGGRIAY